MADSKTTGDVQARLKRLFAGTIEQMLEAEMDEHLRRFESLNNEPCKCQE